MFRAGALVDRVLRFFTNHSRTSCTSSLPIAKSSRTRTKIRYTSSGSVLWKAILLFVHTVLRMASTESFARQREEHRRYLAPTAEVFICFWKSRSSLVQVEQLTQKSRRCLGMTSIRRGRGLNRLWSRSVRGARPANSRLRSLSKARIDLRQFSKKTIGCRRRTFGRLRYSDGLLLAVAIRAITPTASPSYCLAGF